jgi:hypothetical protein
MDPTFNPFSQSAVNLNQYVQAARPQIAGMFGMGQQQPQQPQPPAAGMMPWATPQSNPQAFNQTMGGPPGSPNDGSLVQKMLMALKQQQQPAAPGAPAGPGAPVSLTPPSPSMPAPPPGMQGGFSPDFMGRYAQMGSQPGAGLLSKFAYLSGMGRSAPASSGNLGAIY